METNRIFSARPPFRVLLGTMKKAVDQIHSKRKERGGVEMSFRLEMEELLGVINWERANRNEAAFEMRELLLVEISASGHVDYANKLALYAAELVAGISSS